MTRKLVAFLTALLLVFGLTFAAPALALHAVQDEGGGTVSLDRTGEGDNVSINDPDPRLNGPVVLEGEQR